MVPMEVLSSSPAGYVEFQARIHFGAVVEFSQPRPVTWTPGRIYQMKMVKTLQSRGLSYQTTSSGDEVKIKMTVKYIRVNVSIPNIVVSRTAAARDLINAWWEAVERNQIKDPNILCLSKGHSG
jgi:hypothetical protein